MTTTPNPFLALDYEPAFESLGDDFFDRVTAAEFPRHILRYRNDDLLPRIGLDPGAVTDADFLVAFGHFRDRHPLLAMRYHGFQFGQYNPYLGDGRGFLYGQVRGTDGELYDFGTKGSGTTPYSRSGDGRLTLKGGVREIIAAEALHRYGVTTSRCLSLIETGESLWRGDEPSPTRSSVMVRFSRSHIRFGTFERLHYLDRPDLVQILLDHVLDIYYPHLLRQSTSRPEAYVRFYAELVQRVADLAAQWMSVGFCHAVLNTDNMSITGESFDYGPYAFIEAYTPTFTAAYFDYAGRYCYINQPRICRWNLEMLQIPLKMVIPVAEMEVGLAQFEEHFQRAYRRRMLNRLGLEAVPVDLADALIRATLDLLLATQVSYHDFFAQVRSQFSPQWRETPSQILADLKLRPRASQSSGNSSADDEMRPDFRIPRSAQAAGATSEVTEEEVHERLDQWRQVYGRSLRAIAADDMVSVQHRLNRHNPDLVPVRSEIEAIWEPIVTQDDWAPFYTLLARIKKSVED